MYDTINFRLNAHDVGGGVDFLEETTQYFEVVGCHEFADGQESVSGRLGGLKVIATRGCIKVKDGSLCKYALGDNYQTLGRRDVQEAIERLSDELHLPIDRATITRMDIAQNFIVRHPTDVYFARLGVLAYATRLQEPHGLYYSLNGGRLAFYDKNQEQRAAHAAIPAMYDGRNVLRYEQRYTERIAKQMRRSEIPASMLYDEDFYVEVVNRWRDRYRAIKKINEITINFDFMKTIRNAHLLGLLSLIERAGGQQQMMEQIADAQRRGELKKKQAFDLRTAFNAACQTRTAISVPSDVIVELDKKIEEAVKYYR